jgi:hypothetical protein
MLHDINNRQNFETLSLKPNGQIKTWVHLTVYHPIQQSPGMGRPMKLAGGAFQNTAVQLD